VKKRPVRLGLLLAVAAALLVVWAFPILWGLLTSLKTERDEHERTQPPCP
jgi:hypothetical protein